MAEIFRHAKQWFDPRVVNAFEDLISSGEIASCESTDCAIVSALSGVHTFASANVTTPIADCAS
jgi:hypothetical protein